MKVTLKSGLEKKLLKTAGIAEGLDDVAEAIADKTRENIAPGAKNTTVSVDEQKDKALVIVSFPNQAGLTVGMVSSTTSHMNKHHYLYQEFGGERHRPPPMPLRRAAESVTGQEVKERKR